MFRRASHQMERPNGTSKWNVSECQSHAGQDVASHLVGGARGGAKLFDVSLNGGMDLLGSVVETEMLEQHGGGQDGRGRIGLVLAVKSYI